MAKQAVTWCRCNLAVTCFLLALLHISCARESKTETDSELSTLGRAEVTARLVEIPGQFPPNDLYNYAYVLKYQVLEVHRGNVDAKEIFVGQYNPLKPRSAAQDEVSGKVGGNLNAFRSGDTHRMALEWPLDQHWMGGIIDKYFGQQGVRYWALWTNQVQK